MQVRDIMNPHVVSIDPTESAALAARLLARHNVGSLPVCGSGGQLQGMVTDRDLVVRCLAGDKAPGSVRVGSVMTKRLVSVPETMDVTMAARVMAKEQVRRLPVTGQGGLVGYLTLADLSRVDDLSMEAGECLGEICAPVRHLD